MAKMITESKNRPIAKNGEEHFEMKERDTLTKKKSNLTSQGHQTCALNLTPKESLL